MRCPAARWGGRRRRYAGNRVNETTYLIDENGIIANAFGAVKPKDNAAQMLDALE